MIAWSKIVSSFNCLLGLVIPQTGVQGLGPGGVGPGGKAAKPGKAPVPGECGGLTLYLYMEISMIIDQLSILLGFFFGGFFCRSGSAWTLSRRTCSWTRFVISLCL